MCSKKVLLLNASNIDVFPVYPYSFIQVSAVARQAGIEVICKDLLGIPQKRWEQTVRVLQRTVVRTGHRGRAILVVEALGIE